MTHPDHTTDDERKTEKKVIRYVIGQVDIDWSDSRWEHKGGWGTSPKRRDGYIGLWDRNICRFKWFKIVRKFVSIYAYLVERNTPIKPNQYWYNTLESNNKYLSYD